MESETWREILMEERRSSCCSMCCIDMFLPGEEAADDDELARMSRTIELIDSRTSLVQGGESLKTMLTEESARKNKDADLIALITEEICLNTDKLQEVETQITASLIQTDEADNRPVILEVRAGTGGDEASLFAQEVFKMYERFVALQ